MPITVNLNNVENSTNKVTAFQVTPDDTHYPSEKLVKDSLDGKQVAGTYASGTGSASGTNTGDETDSRIATILAAATTDATPLDTDFVTGIKASGSTLGKWTWTVLKAFLKTYFDSIYKATFSENTAFNKNFGTTTGTVAEGDDSRFASLMARKITLLSAYFNVIPAYGAETRMMIQYGTSANIPTVSGTATIHNIPSFSVVSTDFPTINGVTPKFRLRVFLSVNNTAPAANYSFGLFPITTPASSGGALAKSFTIGTIVTDSIITQNTPTANTQYELVSTTFALPANGVYALCVTNSGAGAANSYVTTQAILENFYE